MLVQSDAFLLCPTLFLPIARIVTSDHPHPSCSSLIQYFNAILHSSADAEPSVVKPPPFCYALLGHTITRPNNWQRNVCSS